MFTIQYLLFSILLMLGLGAAISFSLFVVKPLQTRWAIIKARDIVTVGRPESDWQFRNVYRMLATSKNDLEAAKLWQQLDEIRGKYGEAPKKSKVKKSKAPVQYVAIIPPGGKFASSDDLTIDVRKAKKVG
jgi:hypothetical protein